MIVGRNRTEAIDWVQDQINYGSRPLAELTYEALVKHGYLVEGKASVASEDGLNADVIRDVGKQAYNQRETRTVMQTRRARSSARRAMTGLSRTIQAATGFVVRNDKGDGED
jgi:hypothetical protein